MTWESLVELLELVPHPEEGGYYRETYRSRAKFEAGEPFNGARSVGTAIYFLLTADSYSAIHRLPGDEIFHHYLGDEVEMLMLHPDGSSGLVTLTSDLAKGRPQHVVPGGVWQGSKLAPGGCFALLGTTMGSGFEFEDYESGTAALLEEYPDRRIQIAALLPRPRAR